MTRDGPAAGGRRKRHEQRRLIRTTRFPPSPCIGWRPRLPARRGSPSAAHRRALRRGPGPPARWPSAATSTRGTTRAVQRRQLPAREPHRSTACTSSGCRAWEALAASLDGVDPAQLASGHARRARRGVERASPVGLRDEVLRPAEQSRGGVRRGLRHPASARGREDDARTLIEANPVTGIATRSRGVGDEPAPAQPGQQALGRRSGPHGRATRVHGSFGTAPQQEFPFRVPGYRQDLPSWSEDRATITRAVRRGAAALPDEASPLATQRRRPPAAQHRAGGPSHVRPRSRAWPS